MNTSFKNLIDKNLYQVFLFASPSHIPFSIYPHPWVVINKRGQLSRYEVRHTKNKTEVSLGYIHINNLPLFDGIEVFSFLSHPRWNATLLGKIEGGENSPAHKMCEFIENSPQTYTYKNRYSLLGPNSNTYIQWILDNSPEFKVKLPWTALGKKYK